MKNYKALITLPAQSDLDEIFYWYEKQKNGLGKSFISDFDNTLNKIISNPFYPSTIEEDARIASLKRFPYYIVYRIVEKQLHLRIIAIIHQHRNPNLIHSRADPI